MGTGGSFPVGKAAGAWSWPLTSVSSAEVKNAWSYTCTPLYVFMAWCLVKHRDNFTFALTFYLYIIPCYQIDYCYCYYHYY